MPSSDQIASASRPSSSRMRRRQRQPPGRVHAPAVGREHAQPPVADLVAEALHHDRAVRRGSRAWPRAARAGRPRGCARRARRGRATWRARPAPGPRPSGRTRRSRGRARPGGPGRRRARTARRPGAPGRGRDDHAVARDLLDPPGRGAQQERLARPRLVDHLLVELAHPPAVRQVHAVEAAVGDRAGVGHRQLERALARADRVLHAVPHDPRPQLGELLGRVAAVEHVEHVVEQLAATRSEYG